MLNEDTSRYEGSFRTETPEGMRRALSVRLEWFFLLVRYTAYSLLLGAYAVGAISEYTPDLFVVTVFAFLHNLFVHLVLYTRKHHLFLTPLNLFLHLFKISLLTGLTGGGESPFAIMYLLVIVGYGLYSQDLRHIWSVVLSTSFALAVTLLVEWAFNGINFSYPVVMYLLAFLLSGIMMDRMGDVLRTAEEQTRERTHALLTSEATLRAILDSTPSPILVCDDQEMIVDANERACVFLGVERPSLLGRRVRAFIFDDGTLPQKLAALRSKGAYRGQFLILGASGEERDVDLIIRSFIRQGRRYHVAMLLDITEQKNFQEASRLATQRLERLNRELREVNDLRVSFYTKVAQRLRSPLTAAAGYADLLLEEKLGPLSAEQRGAIKNTRECCRRMFEELDEAFETERLRTELRPSKPPASEPAESANTH